MVRVAYHGSPALFSQIRESGGGGRFAALVVPHDGIWFTSSREEARWYARLRNQRGYVYAARLTLQRPYVYPREAYADEGIGDFPDTHHLRQAGYDGAIVERGEWGEGYPLRMVKKPTHYVVFEPSQVTLTSVKVV